LTALANAHIDTAWLWPFRETERKVARTFSNALALLDEHPDVVFASSQVQHLAWIEERHPDLFERIKARVEEGRWVIVGGTWVEPDGNMPAGESFARQFLLGQTWLAEHLGRTADIFWLPDTFGYSAGMPQIARAAGCDTFITQKLSWNSVNVFPYTTLLWEGLDGSRLLTHFPPADDYACAVLPLELVKAQKKMAKQPVGAGLFLYGFGDGGGGPTREMAARIDQLANVAGLPRLRHGTPAEFFDTVRAQLPHPPVWSGELYLEYHRGTLTSQAQIKQLHRHAELLLREAEIWATAAHLQKGWPYPAEELRELWRETLVMEFHDVLPGTSIGWVHDEAVERLEAVVRSAQGIVDEALGVLAGSGSAILDATASPHGQPGVPALGSALATQPAAATTASESHGRIELANDRFRAVISDGVVTSLVDLTADRELVAPGQELARYRMHPDRPTRWDAWDLDEPHLRGTVVVPAASWELVSDASVVVEREWRGTAIRTHLRLRDDGLEITTDVDWHAEDCLLRLECDLDVLAGLTTAETMYGFVQRPTAANTSWEQAKFETSAHRWLHVGEPGYGVGLLTPTTYGHQVTRQERAGGGVVIRIGFSLLRSAAFPDPRRDAGRHTFRHLLLPGADIPALVTAADREAFPLRQVRGQQFEPVVSVDSSSVAVVAVKLAEDSSGDVIVRLRETCGTAARADVRLCVPASPLECDLIERPLGAIDPEDMRLRPFEVKTLRFRR
jgi:alpha-mannosidase